MRVVIWCDLTKTQTPAFNRCVAPGLVAIVLLDVELPLCNHTRREYRIHIQQATTHPDETLVYLELGPAWSDTLRAEGELVIATPLGFTLHLCEAP